MKGGPGWRVVTPSIKSYSEPPLFVCVVSEAGSSGDGR